MRIEARSSDPKECEELTKLLEDEKIAFRTEIDWNDENKPEMVFTFYLEMK